MRTSRASKRCARRNARGAAFTLVEMTVVVTILALMAALVVPNLVAIRDGQRARAWAADVLRLPTEARNEARRAGVPVTLRVDGDALVMQRPPAPEPGEPADTEAEPQEVRRLDFPEGVTLEAGRRGRDAADAATWDWVVYPDGSADSGGLEFGTGGGGGSADGHRTLLLPARASDEPRWQDGPLREDADERWQAGNLVTRG
jgi:type II secretory pathway pseudopilin PulG